MKWNGKRYRALQAGVSNHIYPTHESGNVEQSVNSHLGIRGLGLLQRLFYKRIVELLLST